MTFKKTLIIGLGLIGGSFAKALKENKISEKIFACDLDSEMLEFAVSELVIDGGFDDLEYFKDDLKSFDLIVISSPLATYEDIFFDLKNNLSSDAIIIDLGSIKNLKIKNLPENFIPCHPIAGSQESGFENSSGDLFRDKKFIISSQNSAAKKISNLAKKIGANPEFLEAKKHDEIYALMSHLPQFISFLTKDFSPKNIEDEFLKNAFRLDDSNPEIWSDIFEMNQENLEKFYLEFFDNLEKNVKNISQISGANQQSTIDEKFFAENFVGIFFRILVAKSYLEISQIKNFQSYAGSGFKDFTSIVSLLNCNQENLKNLIQEHQVEILKLLKSIS